MPSEIEMDCLLLRLASHSDELSKEITELLRLAWRRRQAHEQHAERANTLLWTRLHSGHWASVDSVWRQAYAASALLMADVLNANPDSTAGEALRTIDLALMLGDLQFRKVLLRTADVLERRLAHAESASPPASSTVPPQMHSPLRKLTGALPTLPRLQLPSLALFYNQHMVPASPAILTGVIDGWPACSTRPWSDLSYLKQVAGHRTVPVEVGAHYLDEAFDEQVPRPCAHPLPTSLHPISLCAAHLRGSSRR